MVADSDIFVQEVVGAEDLEEVVRAGRFSGDRVWRRRFYA